MNLTIEFIAFPINSLLVVLVDNKIMFYFKELFKKAAISILKCAKFSYDVSSILNDHDYNHRYGEGGKSTIQYILINTTHCSRLLSYEKIF